MSQTKIQSFFDLMPETQFNYTVHISPKLDFIYFSVPKNACSTITVLLRSYFEDDVAKIKSNVHDRDSSSLLRPCDVGYDKFIKLLESSDVFKFTVVRNPYSRILSAYLNKFVDIPKQNMKIYKMFLDNLVASELRARYMENPEITFIEFLNFVSSQKPYQMNAHWRPQFIQAFMNIINYNAVYAFENLNFCLQELVDKLGHAGYFSETAKEISSFMFRPHKTDADRLISNYYTNECINIFNKVYAADIDNLHYQRKNLKNFN